MSRIAVLSHLSPVVLKEIDFFVDLHPLQNFQSPNITEHESYDLGMPQRQYD